MAKAFGLCPSTFPKCNVRLILDKVRQAVTPVYKEFASQFLKDSQFQAVPFLQFREAILKVLPDNITEQEILTLGRHYNDKVQQEKYSTASIRRYAQDILKKELFDNFQALREGFLHQDAEKNGCVSRKTAYAVIRGAKVPLDVEIVQLILEKLGKGPQCLIYYDEFIDFLDHVNHPVPPIQPINVSSALSWQNLSRPEPHTSPKYVVIKGFIDDLQLENTLRQESA